MEGELGKGNHGDVWSGTHRKGTLKYGRYPSNLYQRYGAPMDVSAQNPRNARAQWKSPASCEVGRSKKAHFAASCPRCPVRSPAFSGLAFRNRDAILSSPMGEAMAFPKTTPRLRSACRVGPDPVIRHDSAPHSGAGHAAFLTIDTGQELAFHLIQGLTPHSPINALLDSSYGCW